jgi:phage host-nuclease inhibitor protein Gam
MSTTTTRAKRAAIAALIKDRTELERKLASMVRAKIHADALTAELNAEIETIKARFAPKLEALKEEINEGTTAVESYALSHRAELFGKDSKTASIGGHKLILRDNGGAIVTARGIKTDTVLDRLITHEDEGAADLFVRWKASLNKEAAKAKWPDYQAFLEGVGLRMEHSEDFSIELSLVEAADSTLKAA